MSSIINSLKRTHWFTVLMALIGCLFLFILPNCQESELEQDYLTDKDNISPSLSSKKVNNKPKQGRIIDIDKNVYKTVQIGDQWWMAENLMTTKFNDGTPIPDVTNNDEWCYLTTPGYRWYEDNASSYKDIYGALYNWYTGSGDKNVCPIGWHVPTNADWIELTTYLGETNAGGKLKATGTIEEGDGLWNYPNAYATNETGFSALPGGFLDVYYIYGDPQPYTRFISMGGFGFFWTSTTGMSRLLRYDSGDVQVTGIFSLPCGLSIRCVRN